MFLVYVALLLDNKRSKKYFFILSLVSRLAGLTFGIESLVH